MKQIIYKASAEMNQAASTAGGMRAATQVLGSFVMRIEKHIGAGQGLNPTRGWRHFLLAFRFRTIFDRATIDATVTGVTGAVAV